ncbi:family 16 glycosylhydrolase [Brevundimonas sp.]|uniref:family 16 glycosylhydrolase n=1 Tax=Brevundimonas sp. TaxID=1871086 RepID=UPI0039175868
MNLNGPLPSVIRQAFRLGYDLSRILPKQTSRSFGPQGDLVRQAIEKIYVINLDREPERWSRLEKGLRRIKDGYGNDILSLAERHPAVDARSFLQDPPKDAEVDPFYTLADQLFVEPQPRTLPTRFELEAPIRMSRAEVAVAKSHIEVWKRIAQGSQSHALILEDDVWFHPGFARHLDQAWSYISNTGGDHKSADLLYVSYMEARQGAPKYFLSSHVFKPIRGLWNLSGYVLSREGAEKLLGLLPVRGPVDLWINHHFDVLNVVATKRVFVSQRRDSLSTNSYSILPILSKIGAIDSEGSALFKAIPTEFPVFAFGPPNSGQSSLAMALSMLGYRCCSDLVDLPLPELNRLRDGSTDRVFSAYVNVGCLDSMVEELRRNYPKAKFIVTSPSSKLSSQAVDGILAKLGGADVIELDLGHVDAWRILCEHLRCAPPFCPFPRLEDVGQRIVIEACDRPDLARRHAIVRRDQSPWVVEPNHLAWLGVRVSPNHPDAEENWVDLDDGSDVLNPLRCSARSDTFTGNLALFRPQNVEYGSVGGATIYVRREDLGVRRFSAGAVSSHADHLFGRFESTFRASNVPGVVTGFFLHRNSPHQEIDIEIAGNRPSRMLVNVFYNPGDPGAKFDYGYRGSPSYIELGFDASKGMHRYAIEWTPNEIRWFVDDLLVHRRVLWDPTPIPRLPMKLHFNTWPSRASQLAGRLNTRRLPAIAQIHSIRACAHGPSLLLRESIEHSGSDAPAIGEVSL